MTKLFEYVESLPWLLGAFLVVAILVLITIGGLVLIRSLVSLETLKSHHDVAGPIYTNIGLLYGVLLGFTVVNVQQRFDKLKETVQIEASYLSELYRDSEVFPEHNRTQIRQSIKNYAHSVLNEEWALMSKKRKSPETIDALKNIWDAYYDVEPTTKKIQAWYAESIKNLNQLMNARLARLLGSEDSLGTEMWTLLILGGVIMTTFLWFFGLDNLKTQLLMASILAASIAFLLFLIYSLDTPFSGSVNIPSEAMVRVFHSFI